MLPWRTNLFIGDCMRDVKVVTWRRTATALMLSAALVPCSVRELYHGLGRWQRRHRGAGDRHGDEQRGHTRRGRIRAD
jgi:hypothetical protein